MHPKQIIYQLIYILLTNDTYDFLNCYTSLAALASTARACDRSEGSSAFGRTHSFPSCLSLKSKIRRAGSKERTTASACGRVPHSSRSHALRGAPKGRVGHSITRACGRSKSLILVGWFRWVSFTLRQNNGASSYQTKHRASPEGVPFKLFAFGTEVCSKCGDLLDFGNRGFSNTPCSEA